MLAIVDYGVGNLFSLSSSLDYIGVPNIITSDACEIKKSDRIILPGVGAFGDAAKKLSEGGMGELVKKEAESGKPLMGICLGMQLLFEKSYEFGEFEGLGLIPGEVVPMQGKIPSELKIPHIGWNPLKIKKKSEILKYVGDGDCVYFVHSFFVDGNAPCVDSSAEYGAEVAASVSRGNVFGCQFHPEKSGDIGLSILKAFSEV